MRAPPRSRSLLRHPLRLAAPFLLAVAGCGGGDGGGNGGAGGPTAPGAGSLSVVVTGLPADQAPSVQVTAPDGTGRTLTAGGVVTGLTPGRYTITPGRVRDVGLDYVADAATVTVAAGAQATGAVAYHLAVLPRSATNRADETPLPKYRILYVLPSDGADRALDTDGTIARTVSSWERWYAAQTGGRTLRLDTSGGALDVTFVRLARTDAQMTAYGDFIRDSLEKQLGQLGQTGAANTLLLVYYDGGHQTRCGSSASPPGLPGVVAALFLRGLATGPVPCASNAFAMTPSAAPGYLEFVAAHEALHLLGIVTAGAPNFVAGGHVGNDPTDLMYAGAQAWRPATLDVSRSSYYNPGGLRAGLVNVAQSPYLATP